MDIAHLRTFAAQHHGLVDQARLAGAGVLSRSGWYRAVTGGLIETLHPGVGRLVGALVTRDQLIAAAVVGAGPGAMASHRSAAHLWGVSRPDGDPIDVILPIRTRKATLDGVVVHRPRDRKDLSPVLRSGIRASNVLRMLCDLGAVDPPAVEGAVGHVVTTGLASPAALRDAVDVHARRGRHGVPALRDVLDDWVLDGKPVDSVLEPAMAKLLAGHGLPAARFHAVLCGWEVDFWFADSPIVLECDGWDSHGRNKVQFEKDRARDTELTAAAPSRQERHRPRESGALHHLEAGVREPLTPSAAELEPQRVGAAPGASISSWRCRTG